MSIESALYDRLSTYTTLTDETSTRIYPDRAVQDDTLPYLTYQVISGEHTRHMTAGDGLAFVRVQFDVFAADSVKRRTIADALFTRFHGYRGQMGTENLEVRYADCMPPVNGYIPPTSADGEGIFTARVESTMIHAVSVPTF